jgi:hypothetical protein
LTLTGAFDGIPGFLSEAALGKVNDILDHPSLFVDWDQVAIGSGYTRTAFMYDGELCVIGSRVVNDEIETRTRTPFPVLVKIHRDELDDLSASSHGATSFS